MKCKGHQILISLFNHIIFGSFEVLILKIPLGLSPPKLFLISGEDAKDPPPLLLNCCLLVLVSFNHSDLQKGKEEAKWIASVALQVHNQQVTSIPFHSKYHVPETKLDHGNIQLVK